MEITLELIVFTVLALFIGVSAILAVTTRRILRAATYLLFVLFVLKQIKNFILKKCARRFNTKKI